MNKSEIVGLWSLNAPFETDLMNDKQLHFYEDGKGSVLGGAEIVLNFEWSISESGNDILIGNSSLPSGEIRGKRQLLATGATLKKELLPLGEFLVLEFERFSLPFGLRRFAKLKT